MKTLLYSDLHLRPERIEDCKLVLKYIGLLASKMQDKLKEQITIINGGDTFNTRGLIHTSCFDVLYKEYENWKSKGLNQWIIVGNHDQEDKAGTIHPMSVFQSWKGWEVIDKPRQIGHFALFPYMPDRELAKKMLAKFLKAGAKDAVVHWGIAGAHMNDWRIDTDGIPADWLEGYRQVFSGHYHYRNSFQNIQYIGSPMQQNFAEKGQEKGVIFFDQKKGTQKFYEVKGTPKHYEVEVVQGEEPELPEVTDKDFLKMKVKGDADFCKTFRKDSFDVSVASIKVERSVSDRHTSRLNIDTKEILSPVALMEKYVDYVDTPLNKERLMNIGKEIVSGV